jgi:hypothetical protein
VGGAGGLAGAAAGLAIPVTIAAVAAVAAKTLTDAVNQQAASQGLKTDFMAPGSGFLPFGIEASLHNIGEIIGAFGQQGERDADRSYDAIENARRDANRKDDRTYDSIEKLRSGTQLVDVTNGSALAADIATAVSRKADVEADRLARGIKDTGPSKTIVPRLKFLAEGHSGEKDVAVVNALTSGFEKGTGKAFRSSQALKDAIKAVSKDIKTLPPKFTAPLSADLRRLKAELARREAINISVPVTNKVTINGREVTANLGRYVTIVNGTPTGGQFGG